MSRRCDQPAGHIGYGDLFIVLQISVRTDRIRPPHLVRHVRDRILTEYLLRLIGIERRSRQLLKPVDSPDMIKVSVGEQDPFYLKSLLFQRLVNIISLICRIEENHVLRSLPVDKIAICLADAQHQPPNLQLPHAVSPYMILNALCVLPNMT